MYQVIKNCDDFPKMLPNILELKYIFRSLQADHVSVNFRNYIYYFLFAKSLYIAVGNSSKKNISVPSNNVQSHNWVIFLRFYRHAYCSMMSIFIISQES